MALTKVREQKMAAITWRYGYWVNYGPLIRFLYTIWKDILNQSSFLLEKDNSENRITAVQGSFVVGWDQSVELVSNFLFVGINIFIKSTDNSINCLKKIISIDPTYYIQIAHTYQTEGQYQEAQECYKELIHLRPFMTQAYSALARLLIQQYRLTQALLTVETGRDAGCGLQGELIEVHSRIRNAQTDFKSSGETH